MAEIQTGIPETQTQNRAVIELQAVRQKSQPEPRQELTLPRQDGHAHHLIEAPQKEQDQAPEVGALTAAVPSPGTVERINLSTEATETRLGLEAVQRKLREEQEKGEGRGAATTEAATPNLFDIEAQEKETGLPPGKMEVALDKYSTALIDTPEEKARKREQIPEEEREQLTNLIQTYGSRPLSEEEWQVLERSRYLDTFFNTLDAAGRGKVGYKQELLEKELHERVGKLLKERMTDRYPDWWQVYDKDGNRIWKMSLMDKALLAKWRQFDNLPPDEKLAILREWANTHIRKEETVGEKFAKVIELLFDFLIALVSPAVEDEENSDRPA